MKRRRYTRYEVAHAIIWSAIVLWIIFLVLLIVQAVYGRC